MKIRSITALLTLILLSLGTAGIEAQSTSRFSIPDGAEYVASAKGQWFYHVRCSAVYGLGTADLQWFNTAQEAEAAGYHPSNRRGCAGPAAARAPITQSESAATTGVCVIARILDGHSLACGDHTRVRLLSIEAPELRHWHFGVQAQDALAALLPVGTRARLEAEVQQRDPHQRLLAYVYAPDGRLVNEELVRGGFAALSPDPLKGKHAARLSAAANEAKESRVGLWSTTVFECAWTDQRAGRCD